MSEKHGKDWHVSHCPGHHSKFDSTLRKFYQNPPCHNVKFKSYRDELKYHISEGTNPAFGYPIPIFEEREINKAKYEMPV
jgi:hypothetical protein